MAFILKRSAWFLPMEKPIKKLTYKPTKEANNKNQSIN